MANPKLAARYEQALLARGYAVVPGASGHYTVLYKEGAGPYSWFWLGPSGAIRHAGYRRIDASRTLGPKSRAKLLEPLTPKKEQP